MKHFLSSFLVKGMKFAEKIRCVLACLLLAIVVTSCTSERLLTKEERSVPTQMLETAYNLVRAKLVKLNIENDVVIEIDTLSCSKRYSRFYDSWIGEVLNVGRTVEEYFIAYKVSARNKPYFVQWNTIVLRDSGQLYRTEYSYNSERQTNTITTVPDTTLESIGFNRFFLRSLPTTYLVMPVEEAIHIARQVFGLDSSIPCTRAIPFQESSQCSLDNRESCQSWELHFLLVPSDTTAYYSLNDTRNSEDEGRTSLQKRKKQGEYFNRYPQEIFICWVDAETGQICKAGAFEKISYDQLHPVTSRLQPMVARLDAIRDSLAREYLRQKVRE